MSDELFSHRLRKYRESNGYSQDDAGKLLGVTGRYIGMLERGEKDVEPHSALAKLFALLEANKVHPGEFEPKRNGSSSQTHTVNEPAAQYHATQASHSRSLNVADVITQIRHDLQIVETGAQADKRRALMFLREMHLPCLAKLLNLE